MRAPWSTALLCCGAIAVAAAESDGLLPVPRPDLSRMEPQVQQQFEHSLRTLDQLLADDSLSSSELAQAYGNTGLLFMLYEFLSGAHSCLLNAVHLDPGSFRWLYYLGVVQEGQGDRDAASVSLKQALELAPQNLPTLIRLGQVELSLGRPNKAAELFRQILEIDPGNAAAHYGLGRIALLQDDAATAISEFKQVLARQPQASTAHYQLGLAYREAGEHELARSHLARQGRTEVEFEDPLMQELASLVRGSSLFVVGATRAKAAGSFDEAVALFRLALETDPQNNSARQALASTLIQMGELDVAVAELERALVQEPESLAAHYNLGTVLAQQGQLERAIEHLSRATEIDPEFDAAHVNLAVLLAQQGDFEAASRHYARALAANPDDIEARRQLAALLVRQGRTDEAISQLRQVSQRRPGTADIHLQIARALGAQHRYSEAAESFAQVLELQPENREALFGRSLTLLLSESYSEAATLLEHSLERQPENLDLKHLLARFLATCPEASLRDGVRALRLAQEVMRARPNLEYAQTVAMAFAEVGQFEEALAVQKHVIERAGASVSAEQAVRHAEHLERYRQGRPVRAPWLVDR